MGAPRWADGDAYEAYVGRWSRRIAVEFVGWLEVPYGLRWLDVGCGTGALTSTILEVARPADVTGVDPSEAFLAIARASVPGATFQQGDARALSVPAASVDVVVSGLALNFVPEPEAAVAEFARVAHPGATVAAYVWDYADGMAMMRYFWDAAAELDRDAAAIEEGLRFPLCRPEPLRLLWTDAGLVEVGVTGIEVPTVFADFDDYWVPFLGGQGPAPGYVATLSEEGRASLRDFLRSRLPVAADGSIAMTARAWAVKGTVPV
jgi:trans-aconitate methyltransferase